MKVYNYQTGPGGGPVLIEVLVQPPGATANFMMHYVSPLGQDVVVSNQMHEVFVLSGGVLPAKAVLYLKAILMPPAMGTLLMRAVQGGSIVTLPTGGHQVSGGVVLGGMLVDAVTGQAQPIPQHNGVTTIGPLQPGAQGEIFLMAH